MENEVRYYLTQLEQLLNPEKEVVGYDINKDFNPTYLVVAIKLPTGAIELITNTSKILEKIQYYLEAYDEDMKLKTNQEISVANIMVV